MFEKIVWATDGSPAADTALPTVQGLAAREGTKLYVLHCIDVFVGPRSAGLPVNADAEELQAKVKAQAETLAQGGADAELRVVESPGHGGPARAIADVAGELGADLIVVGTRGHTALAGLMVGGVTQRLLHLAPCPVLAVPATR
jgi:nucleotide-binding universal stress UspA family protein